MDSGILNKDHIAAGLSCIGRTGIGVSIAYLKLDVSNLMVHDASILNNYTSLQDISLTNNQLTDLSCLSTIPYLLKLDASRNKLTNYDVLDGLMKPTYIATLNLSYNLFNEIPSISHLTYLRELRMDHNSLTTLDGISELHHLTVLSVRHNHLQDISDFNSNQPIRQMYLDNNEISDISKLSTLSFTLEELTMNRNSIISLSSLAQLSSLIKLDISANNINNIEEIHHLKTTTSLTHLIMKDNPLCFPKIPELITSDQDTSILAYSERIKRPLAMSSVVDPVVHQSQLRMKVLALLPHLQELDLVSSPAEERVRAMIHSKAPPAG
eukprot:NODE_4631_length_1138_cov_53.866010_g4111_i0.p1 GENE.NODE_4631_length_1138_cov_53.866010_g4111_i0~~NODE_4631_length_1138_cov_53.866010_g4111_i0.p1  ORF type:complete len:325 (-),score=46.42 NODE_4631_length_1138_cov_53.866010_g4111_i0:110-1084(-)